jgi:hypothetical protein
MNDGCVRRHYEMLNEYQKVLYQVLKLIHIQKSKIKKVMGV